MPKLRSIQGEQNPSMPMEYLPCRALSRHVFDGGVFVEVWRSKKRRAVTVWVARLECVVCGTHRVDYMKPKTCDLLYRGYVHPANYDGTMTPERARKILFKHMVDNNVRLSALAG